MRAAAIRVCRLCRSPKLRRVLDYGCLPLTSRFPLPKQDVPSLPLEFVSCEECGLVQGRYRFDPRDLYDDYSYATPDTSFLRRFAHEIDEAAPGARIVEVGSGNGALLRHLRDLGHVVAGVEPCKRLAKEARRAGIDTVTGYFDSATARSVGTADVVIAANVLEHIEDLNTFFRALGRVLRPGGIFVVQVPYLKILIERRRYDVFVHEHVLYFTLQTLSRLLEQNGLSAYDAYEVPRDASIVVHARSSPRAPTWRLRSLRAREADADVNDLRTHKSFGEGLSTAWQPLVRFLRDFAAGKRVVGYGASIKGNLLLNYCGLDESVLRYVASSVQVGHVVPGVNVPIRSLEFFREDRPDFALILPWNHAAQIIDNEAAYLAAGGCFIVAAPEMHLYANRDRIVPVQES